MDKDLKLEEKLKKIRELLKNSKAAYALTGAGISTESGIQDFRSPKSGLWQKASPEEVSSIRAFEEKPAMFYQFWYERYKTLKKASPNITHYFLAELEKKGLIKGIITQNIDSLHQRASSIKVLECHGSFKYGYCYRCKKKYLMKDVFEKYEKTGDFTCEECKSPIKPNVVLFGEALTDDFQEAWEKIGKECDLLFVLGTSLLVYPVADLVSIAKAKKAKLIIINRDLTPYDDDADVVIHNELHKVISKLDTLVFQERAVKH